MPENSSKGFEVYRHAWFTFLKSILRSIFILTSVNVWLKVTNNGCEPSSIACIRSKGMFMLHFVKT